MAKFKNIRVPITKSTGKTKTITKGKNKGKEKQIRKKTGKYRTQRVQVMANGRYKFVKNKKKTGSSKSQSSSSSPKSKKKKNPDNPGPNGGHGMRIYLAPTLGFIALPATVGLAVMFGEMTWRDALGTLIAGYTGFDPVNGQTNFTVAALNYGAIGVGTAASIIASKTGLNKRLPKGINL